MFTKIPMYAKLTKGSATTQVEYVELQGNEYRFCASNYKLSLIKQSDIGQYDITLPQVVVLDENYPYRNRSYFSNGISIKQNLTLINYPLYCLQSSKYKTYSYQEAKDEQVTVNDLLIKSPLYGTYGMLGIVTKDYYATKKGQEFLFYDPIITDKKTYPVALLDGSNTVKNVNLPPSCFKLCINFPATPIWYFKNSTSYKVGDEVEWFNNGTNFITGTIDRMITCGATHSNYVMVDDNYQDFYVSDANIRKVIYNSINIEDVLPTAYKNIYGWCILQEPDTQQPVLIGEWCNSSKWLDDITTMLDVNLLPAPIMAKLNTLVDKTQEYHFSYIQSSNKFNYTSQAMYLTPLAKMREMIKSNSAKEIVEAFSIKQYKEIFEPEYLIEGTVKYTGIPISKGIATGYSLSLSDARTAGISRDTIIVCSVTLPEDVDLIKKAKGVIMTSGSQTCHAAIICNQLKIPAVLIQNNVCVNNNMITIDGTTGKVYEDASITIDKERNAIKESLKWELAMKLINYHLPIKVQMNADSVEQIKQGIEAGCTEVGLFRIEHTFLGEESEYIKELLANPHKWYSDCKFHEQLYKRLIEVLQLPITNLVVRSLDAPMHEFLPDAHESNPMLGNRGIRILMSNGSMALQSHIQAIRAIPSHLLRKLKYELPMVNSHQEVQHVSRVISQVLNNSAFNSIKSLAVMIETPSACLQGGEIAKYSSHLSFGTNDLTQTVLAISRDDANWMSEGYEHLGNPFKEIHTNVWEMIELCVKRARATNPSCQFSICGEQGSDLPTIMKAIDLGINAVSISPSKILDTKYAIARTMYERGNELC